MVFDVRVATDSANAPNDLAPLNWDRLAPLNWDRRFPLVASRCHKIDDTGKHQLPNESEFSEVGKLMIRLLPIRMLPMVAVLLFLIVTSWSHADEPKFPVDRPFDITHIRLELDVDLEAQSADVTAAITGKALRAIQSVTLDAVDFKNVEVRLKLDSGDVDVPRFDYDGKRLVVQFGRTLQRGEVAGIAVKYHVHDPKRGLHFFKPTDEDPQAPFQVWSQGQSISNRYWIPCVDHPNEMQSTEIICTVDEPFIAVSNGEFVSTQPAGEGCRRFHWKLDQPHVAYLVTLVVGDFVSKSETWRGIPITYYVRKQFEDQMGNSFKNTTKMLDFFSGRIGVPYPWPKYDQLCCYQFGGGMENTSSTTLGESTLHDDRAHLDTSSDALVAHELAHQWFGDLITCNDWAHLWLNEGFATYFEALWDEHHNGPSAFAHNMMQKSERAQRGGKKKPIVDRAYPSPGSQFDGRAYSKGAWVLHMLRRRLGDQLFWEGINAYVKQFEHRTVETSDFRRVMERVSGQGLSRFFYDWTDRAGHPVVDVKYAWQGHDQLAKLTIRQTQESDAFHFPLRIEFVMSKPGSTDATVREFTKQIDEKETVVYYSLPHPPDAIRIDADQAVLMVLSEEKPRGLWIAQLHDENPVLQIRAIKHLESDVDEKLVDVLRGILLDDAGFWAGRAEAARVLGEADVDASRDALLSALRVDHPKVLAAVFDAFGDLTANAAVLDAVANLVDHSHASYKVQRAAIESYAKLADTGDEEALARFRRCLQRDSHREIIRSAALRGLAKLGTKDTIAELAQWLEPEHAIDVRRGALEAIGELADEFDEDKDAIENAAALLRPYLIGKHRRLKRSAISAATECDKLVERLKMELGDIADGDDTRVAWAATQALDGISDDDDSDEELERVNDELKRLREQNEELLDRVRRMEAKEASLVPTEASAG